MQQLFYYKMPHVFYYKMLRLLQIATILLQNALFVTNCDGTQRRTLILKYHLTMTIYKSMVTAWYNLITHPMLNVQKYLFIVESHFH